MWRMTEKGYGSPGVGLVLNRCSRCAGSVYRYVGQVEYWIAVQAAQKMAVDEVRREGIEQVS